MAVETVGPERASRSVWFVHGVLGTGRNWRSFARRAVDAGHDLRAVLPSLRNHAGGPRRAPPHDLAACAGDLASLAEELGPPDVLVGHSLGGKVALSWLARGDLPQHTPVWVLDCPPGPVGPGPRPSADPAADPARVLALLRSAPTPAPSREPVRDHLRRGGLSEPVVAWLLTSMARGAAGWAWMYDLDGVQAMLASYAETDLWPTVESAGNRVQLVRAGAGDRWTSAEIARAELAAEHGVGWHVLPHASHWLHVDDPEGTLALLEGTL